MSVCGRYFLRRLQISTETLRQASWCSSADENNKNKLKSDVNVRLSNRTEQTSEAIHVFKCRIQNKFKLNQHL